MSGGGGKKVRPHYREGAEPGKRSLKATCSTAAPWEDVGGETQIAEVDGSTPPIQVPGTPLQDVGSDERGHNGGGRSSGTNSIVRVGTARSNGSGLKIRFIEGLYFNSWIFGILCFFFSGVF